MSSRIDLHLHSTASDGTLTPTELVHLALDKGIQVIALTDHDTTQGIQEALDAARGTGLTVIPGVEVSTDVPGPHELHILGYHIDHYHVRLQQHLASLHRSRLDRARRMLDRLAQAGCPLAWDDVTSMSSGGVIGRPHIAQALVDARYVDSVESAFRLYIGRGAPAYVERLKLIPEDIIEVILDAGGVPVLAHPSRVIEHVPALARAGLLGIEVYYTSYLEPEQRFLASLARKHNLIATGGSDFHGPGITEAADIGIVDVPYSAVEQLAARARRSVPRGIHC
jgi:predicted metal-dependent phosphoesterase TrpH